MTGLWRGRERERMGREGGKEEDVGVYNVLLRTI